MGGFLLFPMICSLTLENGSRISSSALFSMLSFEHPSLYHLIFLGGYLNSMILQAVCVYVICLETCTYREKYLKSNIQWIMVSV